MTVPITTNAVGDIIALVQLGLGAVQRLNNARGAKAEYREIQSRLTGLQSLLELCTASVDSLSDADHKATVMGHIDRAHAQLDTALQLLPGYKRLAAETLASRSIRSRVRDASTSISWELRPSGDARACLVKLLESIQTIQLAITAAYTAYASMQFRLMSSTIANVTAATTAVQTNLSVTHSLVERDSEIRATRHQIVVDEVAELREELADLRRTVEARNPAHQCPAVPRRTSTLELCVSLRGLSLSATTLIQISQAVIPSNELVSGGCIGSFLVFAVSAPRMTDQAAYLFCACLLFIATRMHRIYQSPVVIHIVVIVDLFGDRIQLPLHEARSAEEVHAVLQRQFQPGRIGCIITHNRLYDLAILDDEDALGNLLPRSWANLLQPGQTLVMTARVQNTHNDTNSTCPSCRTPLPQPEEPTIRDRWIRCSRCPARFNRETIDDDDFNSPETRPMRSNLRQEPQPPGTVSRTTIEQELVRCKRIRVLDLNPTSPLALPPGAGPSSPKTPAANTFDSTRYGQDEVEPAMKSEEDARIRSLLFAAYEYYEDEAVSKANTPDHVHPNQSVDLSPESAVEPGDHGDHAQGNGLSGDGPPPKDPPGFDRYLSLEILELLGPEPDLYAPGGVKVYLPPVNDGSAWAITQA